MSNKQFRNGKKSFKRTNTSPKYGGKKDKGAERMFPKNYSGMPKELKPNPIIQYRQRYQVISALSVQEYAIYNAVTSRIVATTATVGISLLKAIRIRRVQVWAAVTTQGTPAGVSILPTTDDPGNNSFNDLPERILDVSISIDKPAYVDYRPKVTHPSGSWHYSNTITNGLFAISAPIGGIIDIDFEAILNANEPVATTVITLAGATAGTIYAGNAFTNNATAIGVNAINV